MVKVLSKVKYGIKSGFRHGFKNVIFSKFFFAFVSSISLIISSHDKAGRIKDNLDARFNEQEDTFDFIVVGGGSAGSLVANRLSESHKVLLLEAGGEPHPLQRIPGMAFFMVNYKETDWMHRTVPQRRACFSSPNRRASWSQGMNLGGSSNLNYMVHLRGSPRDYDNWAKITGDDSWNYAGVLPYFRRHENYQGDSPDREAHGFDGELKLEVPSYTGMAKEFIRAGQELGYEHVDLNARYEEGFDTIYYPLEAGERKGSFSAFLEPIRDRETLVIRKYAHVNKVLIRGYDSTAYGVQYDRHGRRRFAYATKEVIISAGSVESAKLLMLSGIGPKTHLADLGIPIVADLPVGRNLQDHLATFLGPFFIDPPRSYLIDRDITAKSFYEYKADGNGPLSTSLFQAAAMVSSKKNKYAGAWNWPDIQLLMSGMGGHKTFSQDMAHAFHLNEKTIKKYYEPALGRDSFFIAVSASRPFARGEIVLEKKDPYAPMSINPRYLENEHDMGIIIEGIKTALYLVENTTSFQNLRARFTSKKFPGCEHMSFRSDDYFECYVRHLSISLNDPVGTCAMGHPHMGRDGVLDNQLQVIGVNHLRVVDASVMPTIVGSSTEAAVLMIAEKGSDIIMEAWRTRDASETKHNKENQHHNQNTGGPEPYGPNQNHNFQPQNNGPNSFNNGPGPPNSFNNGPGPPPPQNSFNNNNNGPPQNQNNGFQPQPPYGLSVPINSHPGGTEDGWREFEQSKGFTPEFDINNNNRPNNQNGPPNFNNNNGPPNNHQNGPPNFNNNNGQFPPNNQNGPPPNFNNGGPNNNQNIPINFNNGNGPQNNNGPPNFNNGPLNQQYGPPPNNNNNQNNNGPHFKNNNGVQNNQNNFKNDVQGKSTPIVGNYWPPSTSEVAPAFDPNFVQSPYPPQQSTSSNPIDQDNKNFQSQSPNPNQNSFPVQNENQNHNQDFPPVPPQQEAAPYAGNFYSGNSGPICNPNRSDDPNCRGYIESSLTPPPLDPRIKSSGGGSDRDNEISTTETSPSKLTTSGNSGVTTERDILLRGARGDGRDPMDENPPWPIEFDNLAESSTNNPTTVFDPSIEALFLEEGGSTAKTIAGSESGVTFGGPFDSNDNILGNIIKPTRFDEANGYHGNENGSFYDNRGHNGNGNDDLSRNQNDDPNTNANPNVLVTTTSSSVSVSYSAKRPEVTLLTHDTKMRPGVQVSNPYPDAHYAPSTTTEMSTTTTINNNALLDFDQMKKTKLPSISKIFPITSSVEYPNKIPSPPELGPVYFRNPEYTTRRPIHFGNSSLDYDDDDEGRKRRNDAPGFNASIVAAAAKEAASGFPDPYRIPKGRLTEREGDLSPHIVFKSVGATNKVPSTANIPDIYYKMKDGSYLNDLTNSESSTNPIMTIDIKSSPYWTNPSPSTRPPIIIEETPTPTPTTNSPYWSNASPSPTFDDNNAPPWTPLGHEQEDNTESDKFKTLKLKTNAKKRHGGRVVRIKSGGVGVTFSTTPNPLNNNHNKIKIKIKHKNSDSNAGGGFLDTTPSPSSLPLINTNTDNNALEDGEREPEIVPYFSQGKQKPKNRLTSITIQRPRVKSKGMRGAKQVPFNDFNSPVTITPRPLLSVTIWPDDADKHFVNMGQNDQSIPQNENHNQNQNPSSTPRPRPSHNHTDSEGSGTIILTSIAEAVTDVLQGKEIEGEGSESSLNSEQFQNIPPLHSESPSLNLQVPQEEEFYASESPSTFIRPPYHIDHDDPNTFNNNLDQVYNENINRPSAIARPPWTPSLKLGSPSTSSLNSNQFSDLIVNRYKNPTPASVDPTRFPSSFREVTSTPINNVPAFDESPLYEFGTTANFITTPRPRHFYSSTPHPSSLDYSTRGSTTHRPFNPVEYSTPNPRPFDTTSRPFDDIQYSTRGTTVRPRRLNGVRNGLRFNNQNQNQGREFNSFGNGVTPTPSPQYHSSPSPSPSPSPSSSPANNVEQQYPEFLDTFNTPGANVHQEQFNQQQNQGQNQNFGNFNYDQNQNQGIGNENYPNFNSNEQTPPEENFHLNPQNLEPQIANFQSQQDSNNNINNNGGFSMASSSSSSSDHHQFGNLGQNNQNFGNSEQNHQNVGNFQNTGQNNRDFGNSNHNLGNSGQNQLNFGNSNSGQNQNEQNFGTNSGQNNQIPDPGVTFQQGPGEGAFLSGSQAFNEKVPEYLGETELPPEGHRGIDTGKVSLTYDDTGAIAELDQPVIPIEDPIASSKKPQEPIDVSQISLTDFAHELQGQDQGHFNADQGQGQGHFNVDQGQGQEQNQEQPFSQNFGDNNEQQQLNNFEHVGQNNNDNLGHQGQENHGQNDNFQGQNDDFQGQNDNFQGQNDNFQGQNDNFQRQNNNFVNNGPQNDNFHLNVQQNHDNFGQNDNSGLNGQQNGQQHDNFRQNGQQNNNFGHQNDDNFDNQHQQHDNFAQNSQQNDNNDHGKFDGLLTHTGSPSISGPTTAIPHFNSPSPSPQPFFLSTTPRPAHFGSRLRRPRPRDPLSDFGDSFTTTEQQLDYQYFSSTGQPDDYNFQSPSSTPAPPLFHHQSSTGSPYDFQSPSSTPAPLFHSTGSPFRHQQQQFNTGGGGVSSTISPPHFQQNDAQHYDNFQNSFPPSPSQSPLTSPRPREYTIFSDPDSIDITHSDDMKFNHLRRRADILQQRRRRKRRRNFWGRRRHDDFSDDDDNDSEDYSPPMRKRNRRPHSRRRHRDQIENYPFRRRSSEIDPEEEDFDDKKAAADILKSMTGGLELDGPIIEEIFRNSNSSSASSPTIPVPHDVPITVTTRPSTSPPLSSSSQQGQRVRKGPARIRINNNKGLKTPSLRNTPNHNPSSSTNS